MLCLMSADMLTAVDLSTQPCDDFYEFACGTFLKTAVIPDYLTAKTLTWDQAIYTHTHTHRHTHTHTHIHIYVYVYIYMYIYICLHITHTYIHMYKYDIV
jgi:hypothetical protein